MSGRITLDRVIAFLRIFLVLACCWPLTPNANRFRRLGRYVLRYFCIVNSISIIIIGIWTISKHSDDTFKVLRIGCQMSAAVQIPLQLIVFAMQDERIQFIVFEMKDYYEHAKSYEKEIFQYYIDKCKPLYGCVLCCLIITGFSFICSPLLVSQPFPLELDYPFDMQTFQIVIYIHHIIVIFQSVTQVSANTFPALLLWFVAARFSILSARFHRVVDMKQLLKCAYEHRILLRYAKEVTRAVRYVALLCVTCSSGTVIFGYLTFMSRQPMAMKFIFLMISLCGFVELYMYAWPADNVMSTSSDIMLAAYNSSWYKNDVAMRKIFLHIIFRSQYPIVVSVPCVLPQLSMKYYASYISTVFSYMALIRIIIGEE